MLDIIGEVFSILFIENISSKGYVVVWIVVCFTNSVVGNVQFELHPYSFIIIIILNVATVTGMLATWFAMLCYITCKFVDITCNVHGWQCCYLVGNTRLCSLMCYTSFFLQCYDNLLAMLC